MKPSSLLDDDLNFTGVGMEVVKERVRARFESVDYHVRFCAACEHLLYVQLGAFELDGIATSFSISILKRVSAGTSITAGSSIPPSALIENSTNRSSKHATEITKSRAVRIRAFGGRDHAHDGRGGPARSFTSREARLMSAESEYGSLIARVESRQRRFQVEAIGAKIREVFMHVDTALGQDVPAPRRSSPAS